MNKNRLVLPTNFTQGDNLTYQNINDAFESINEYNSVKGTINIEYLDLLNLSQNGKLIPGAFYRITNYTASVSDIDEEMASAEHYFDIIVQAISETKLSQNARAIQNENDHYFDCANLHAWQLKYELGNPLQIKLYKNDYAYYEAGNEDYQDVDWGDFYLYDGTYEYEGETYYKFIKCDSGKTWGWWILTDTLDFSEVSMENPYTPIATIARDGEIAFGDEQYKSVDKIVYAEIETRNAYKGDILYMKDEFNNECYYDFKNILFKRYWIDSIVDDSSASGLDEWLVGTYLGIKNRYGYAIDHGDYIYVYTFGGEDCIDRSLTGDCYNNSIQPDGNKSPNNITFGKNCYDNYIFSGSHNCSFGDGIQCNTIGHYFVNNTFSDGIWNNSFGNNIRDNSFSRDICENIFGNNIYYNMFGRSINNNSFGNNIQDNLFGNNIENNTFGNNIRTNSFFDGIYENSFGTNIYGNLFQNETMQNTFGNCIQNNSFGDHFRYNTVENHVVHVVVGDYIWNAKFLSGLIFDSNTSIIGIITRVNFCQYIGKNSHEDVVIKNPMD